MTKCPTPTSRRRQSHGRCEMAHLSGSDQAFRQAMQAARFKIEFCGKPAAYLVGVSVEDRKYGLPRVKDLSNSAATVRFSIG